MDKKNIPNNKSVFPKKSGLDITKVAVYMWILTTLLINTPTFGQTRQKSSTNDKKRANIESVEQNDSIYHQKIITQKIQDIFAEYGEEQWLKLINYHCAIEINKIRKQFQITDIDTSEAVRLSAQKQAEVLDKLWYLDHMSGKQSLPRRLERDWVVFLTCWENLADWATTINQLLNDRLISKTHTANLLNKNFKKIGLWYKNGKRVYIAIW